MGSGNILMPGSDYHVQLQHGCQGEERLFVNAGALHPETGNVEQWESPSGLQSLAKFLAVIYDVLWYNESSVRPDVLARLGPQTG